MPEMMTHASDGYRTVWHGIGACADCSSVSAIVNVFKTAVASDLATSKDVVKKSEVSFVGSLFDAVTR